MVSPLGFEVAPEAGSWRWRFVLSNRGDAPMPVVADRRLVWVEVAPPAAPQGVRRPRRRVRVARCVHDGRPASNEASPEVVLGAGDRYAESFDLRDLCNLRVPAGLAEGATVVFHYGFAVPRRGRTRLSRSVVRDERTESVNDLTASVTVPAMPTALVPEEGHRPGANNEEDAASGLGVTVRVGRAVTAAGLRAAVTVTNRSVHPQWALWRPSLLAFEVEPPTGARVLCNTLTRQPSPHREHFVRFAGRARRSVSLVLADFCPLGTFDTAGVYHVRARYAAHPGADEYGLGRVFSGEVNSAQTVARVSRGRGAYVALDAARLR